jgi:hypothetical protein
MALTSLLIAQHGASLSNMSSITQRPGLLCLCLLFSPHVIGVISQPSAEDLDLSGNLADTIYQQRNKGNVIIDDVMRLVDCIGTPHCDHHRIGRLAEILSETLD